MADGNESEDDHIKLLVLENEANADVTLYIYQGWSPICKISTISKIIKTKNTRTYYQKSSFKFKIVAKSVKTKEKKKLLGPEKLNEDKFIKITDSDDSLKLQQKNLSEITNKRDECLRNMHKEELARTNLYDILGLDMQKVRKMNNEDAKEAIMKAYEKKIRDTDENSDYGKAATKHINNAKETLMDDGKRACYHNQVYYDKGWFSLKRWKVIFWPDRYTEEQKKNFRRRVILGTTSFFLAVGGVALSIATAGAAAPGVVALGGLLGGALTGAGFQSLIYTMSRKSVTDKCKKLSWFLNGALGFGGGFITGGAAVGITAGIVGIGSGALELGAVSAAQFVEMGAAIGAVGGVISSLSSDCAKKWVDEEEVTVKTMVLRAIGAGLIGAIAGVLGSLVTKGFVDNRVSAATSGLEGDVVEQATVMTGGRRIRHAVAESISKQLTIVAAKSLLWLLTKVTGERYDDSAENESLIKHIKNKLESFVLDFVSSTTVYTCGGFIGEGIRETTYRNTATSDEAKAESYSNCNEADSNAQGSRNETNENQGVGEESSEPSDRTNEEQEHDKSKEKMMAKSYEKGMNMQNEADQSGNQSSNPNNLESGKSHTKNEKGAPESATTEKLVRDPSKQTRAKFCSHHKEEKGTIMRNEADQSGHQSSNPNDLESGKSHTTNEKGAQEPVITEKLVCSLHKEEKGTIMRNEADESGNQSNNPHTSTEREAPEPDTKSCIEHCWPTQQNPRIVSREPRTNKSSNCEPPNAVIKYISKGFWFSKMIVTYELKGKLKTEESGHGKSVYIPADATDIQVKFQVRRPFWGDVMKYDRFRETWCKPYTPHIYRYKKAVDRTFTIRGPLWWEAVMTVSDKNSEEIKEMS